MKIKVEVKNIYGVEKIYIVSEHLKAVSGLTGKKTIDINDIKNLQSLGFEFELNNLPTLQNQDIYNALANN
jgi:GrpB-like predicted nucleotidyltransferase (UPF0157 family)